MDGKRWEVVLTVVVNSGDVWYRWSSAARFRWSAMAMEYWTVRRR
jgi:hypothetical protein